MGGQHSRAEATPLKALDPASASVAQALAVGVGMLWVHLQAQSAPRPPSTVNAFNEGQFDDVLAGGHGVHSGFFRQANTHHG